MQKMQGMSIKMKITKRQLRRIIREEKLRLLGERNQNIYPHLERMALFQELAARGIDLDESSPAIDKLTDHDLATMLQMLGGPKDVSEY